MRCVEMLVVKLAHGISEWLEVVCHRLVNKDIPSGTVAAGVPAKVIGNFEDYRKKLIKDDKE